MEINYKHIENLIKELTLEEKIKMIHGAGLFRTEEIKRLGIPCLKMSDGPMGVRNEFPDDDWMPVGNNDDFVLYLPSNTALAASWNRKLAFEEGNVLGKEARGRGKDVILAPGINIIRSPLGGRNFEYMSEDPYLTKEMAVPYIKGVQQNDVACCVKHFAVNNQETERNSVNVKVSERALREIYLPGFEAAVKDAGAYSLMSAYNKINGESCSENTHLLRKILKDEWKFDGALISDWGGIYNTVPAAEAGMDLDMRVTYDFDKYPFAEPLLKAVQEGIVKEEVIDEKVRNILKLMYRLNKFSDNRNKGNYNSRESMDTCLKIAEETIVLLKNEDNILPLSENKIKKIAVIGEAGDIKHSLGGGSAEIKSLFEITPLMGLKMKLGGNTEIKFAKGYTYEEDKKEEMINEALDIARDADAVIYTGGLKHTKEGFVLFDNALGSNKDNKVINIDSEGLDKSNMLLPYNQYDLIDRLLKVNKNTVIVINSGSPVDMSSFADKAKAVLYTSYNGMYGGLALAEVLFGDVNPSGKLTYTIPKKLEESPAHCIGEFPGNEDVNYTEDIFVGYRYNKTYETAPLFSFGHGLSYTNFEYLNLKADAEEKNGQINAKVMFEVKNTGKRAGAEAVQVYVRETNPKVKRPFMELKGFDKVFLNPGETAEVEINLDSRAFAYYSEETNTWKVSHGEFEIFAAASSDDIKLKEKIEIKNDFEFEM